MKKNRFCLSFFGLVFFLACSKTDIDLGTPKDPEPGDPVISSISGSIANGAAITIVGSEFGSHPLTISSSVGTDGWIESNSAGTDINNLQDAQGWDAGLSSNPLPVVSQDRAYSGAQSVLARVDYAATGGWQSVLRYHEPETFDRVYFTFWINYELKEQRTDKQTQWKMWRVNHNGITSDQAGDILFISYHYADQSIYGHQWATRCHLDCPGNDFDFCWSEAEADPFYEPRFGKPVEYMHLFKNNSQPWSDSTPEQNKWTRVEVYLERGTVDKYDGWMSYSLWKEGEGRTFIDTIRNVMMRQSRSDCRNEQDPWEYVQFQNFFDDNGGSFTSEKADFFFDDIYVQTGTQARIEIGDRAVYEEGTTMQIQTPKEWSNTSISFEVNYGGSLNPGDTAFLFVINSAGKVSPGVEITLN